MIVLLATVLGLLALVVAVTFVGHSGLIALGLACVGFVLLRTAWRRLADALGYEEPPITITVEKEWGA